MPLHGLKADLELLLLVVSAGAVSYMVDGAVVSNAMFAALLASLFFLMGLHADLRFFMGMRTRWKELVIAMMGIFGVAPLVGLILSYIPGSIGEAALVVGISASAFGSPKIWSNISNSDGELASYSASFSILLGILVIPVLIYFLPLQITTDSLVRNLSFAVVPFLLGIVSQSYENSLIEDMRLHFSKLSFWLIVAITLIQAKLLYVTTGLMNVSLLVASSLVFVVLIVMSFGYSHILARLLGLYEKEARSIGYISSSKSIGVALFIASQVSGEVVLLVCLYYFVRQLMGILITDMYVHEEPRILEKIGF